MNEWTEQPLVRILLAHDELAIIDGSQLRGTQLGLVLGIGDDCAIFRPRAGEDLLFTTDQMIEGVHFFALRRRAAVGERALARSLSDIAAMGGKPRFCLVTLAVPPSHEKWIDGILSRTDAVGPRTGTALAGGDLAHADQVHCDVMVCGSVARGKALRRDGARLAMRSTCRAVWPPWERSASNRASNLAGRLSAEQPRAWI